jgi:hypothetical protein
MSSLTKKIFVPVVFLFVLINVTLYFLRSFLQSQGIDVNFVAGANLILFLISISGLLVQSRSVRSANANAFIRGIYSSLIIKMFTVIGAILIYVAIMSHELNKAGIFIAMAFYMLYTSIEVFQLMKIVRKKSDG